MCRQRKEKLRKGWKMSEIKGKKKEVLIRVVSDCGESGWNFFFEKIK